MSSAKFASLHGGLLARKGLATPAMLPLPIIPQLARPQYTDAPAYTNVSAPGRDDLCCGDALGSTAENQPAATNLHSVRGANPQGKDYEGHHEIGAEHRTHVSVRLSPEQLRRLKTAAAQLHQSQQKIMANGLDFFLDKLAAEDLVGCRCMKAKG